MRPRLGLPGLVGRKTGSLSRLGGPTGTLPGRVAAKLKLYCACQTAVVYSESTS